MFETVKRKITDYCNNNTSKLGAVVAVPTAATTLWLLLFLLFPKIFRAWTIIVEFVFFGICILLYGICAPFLKDKQGKSAKICLSVSFFEMTLFPTSLALYTFASKIHNTPLKTISLMLGIIVTFSIIIALRSEKGKEIIASLDSGILNSLSSKKTVAPGDIVLCNIKEEVENNAKDPREILPAKDRFLHMLILGPTGSGKTSQILLPMINQDMQNPEWGVTILEPKGDLAIKAAMMAKHYGRDYLYFDPSFTNCPKFNPLAGREIDVVENMATTFKMLSPDSPQFFLDLNEQLIRNAVKALKRLDKDCGIEGKYATLINLGRLLQNSGGAGRDMINKFSRVMSSTESEAKENADIASWFINDYFPERSKVYENTSGVRSQVSKLVSNECLRDVLNPDADKGERNEINFDTHLANGGVICISTAQGVLRDLSKYLGYFLILSIQSAVFRRPGNENTRPPHCLYIDEFQTYSTPGFSDMLTQGRSYRVSSVLATQARALMAMGGGRDGKNFVENVSANARNIILFPGLNKDDAKYYSDQFGEYEKTEVMVGTSRKRFNLLTGGLDRLGHPTEMVREQKKMTANFTTTDLIYSQDPGNGFGQIIYSIIKNNSVQPAKVGLISYIPNDLNELLNQMCEEHTKAYAHETAAEYYQHDGDFKTEASEAKDNEFRFPGDSDVSDEELEDLSVDEKESAPDIPLPSSDPALEFSLPAQYIDWDDNGLEEEDPATKSTADIFDISQMLSTDDQEEDDLL